ncbi:MAG: ergothioneine biosynthesis protein EgtC [Pseudanabaenaceae cyanobacterium bins.68]|nr:ergothioneine biosynthesis protein EgtC [Pseudanabaenaceae cyanobacterium bins.68]
MCRLVGYLGKPIFLEQLLSIPSHNLVVQSYQPRQMTSGLLNADGFGFGWYGSDRPLVYRQVLPIWNDPNVAELAQYVQSHSLVANVRSATPGLPVDLSNCQPFRWGKWLFLHNGFIQDFRRLVARSMRDRLADQFEQQIMGNTDSEYIFSWFLHYLNQANSATEALHLTLQEFKDLVKGAGTSASVNLILTDGVRMWAVRSGIGAIAPSLYWQESPTGITIASEPLELADPSWQSVPESSLLLVEPQQVRVTPLKF